MRPQLTVSRAKMAAALYVLCILLVSAIRLTAQTEIPTVTAPTTHAAFTNQTEHTTETSVVSTTQTTHLTTGTHSTHSTRSTHSTSKPTTITNLPTTAIPTTHRTTTTPTSTEKPTTHTVHTTHWTTHTTRPTHTTQTPARTTPTRTPVPSTTVTIIASVITNSNEASTTAQYDSTQFPIWSQTTDNSTTRNPSTTPGSTSRPTHATPTSTPNITSTSTHRPSTSPRTTVTSSSGTSTFLPTPTLPPNPSSPTNPWKVTYGTNGTNCIMMKFAGQIDITYVNVRNKTVQTGFDIPANASVNKALSMCDKKGLSEVLALDFESHGYLVAIFKKDAKTNVSSLFELLVSYPITEELFPGIPQSYQNKIILLSSSNMSLYKTDPTHSYACNSLLSVNFMSVQVKDINKGHILADSESVFKQSIFETRHLKVQAFLPTDKNMDIFMFGTLCSGDQSDTLWTVDFIVAMVIAGLAVIVLVAYFVVKRMKNKSSSDDMLPIVDD